MSDLTDKMLAAWADVARAATRSSNGWYFGSWDAPADDVRAKYVELFDAGDDKSRCHIVGVRQTIDEGGDELAIAVTGNGPTSEANAKHVAWASPGNVLLLLDDLRLTRDERDTAKRVLAEAQAEIADLRRRLSFAGDRPEQF